ncbi:transcription elongation regulator 1-like isoform X2 [Cricetulus griseus]|uniref:transcription elongation regulator 1-like isoform X2 n=1 Tax=Cricetulus griseus TaxID=10029 RepID=UPI0015C3FBE4|nr:transcription elongation regulator 1-like isoform X2 [Cricetulus griseus]
MCMQLLITVFEMSLLGHPAPTMLSIQKWQFSMSAIKEEQELMEEMNEDEPIKAKKRKHLCKVFNCFYQENVKEVLYVDCPSFSI